MNRHNSKPGEDGTGRATVSIMKAAQMASVSRRTVYNWLEAKKLEYTRTPGGSIRIYVDSLFPPSNVVNPQEK